MDAVLCRGSTSIIIIEYFAKSTMILNKISMCKMTDFQTSRDLLLLLL
jgi:hypothetical protein